MPCRLRLSRARELRTRGGEVMGTRIAYDVGCIALDVIQWWQERAATGALPAINEVRIGYDLHGGPRSEERRVGKECML